MKPQPPPTPTKIVLINGACSAGKSTLAWAFQAIAAWKARRPQGAFRVKAGQADRGA